MTSKNRSLKLIQSEVPTDLLQRYLHTQKWLIIISRVHAILLSLCLFLSSYLSLVLCEQRLRSFE